MDDENNKQSSSSNNNIALADRDPSFRAKEKEDASTAGIVVGDASVVESEDLVKEGLQMAGAAKKYEQAGDRAQARRFYAIAIEKLRAAAESMPHNDKSYSIAVRVGAYEEKLKELRGGAVV